MTIKYMLFPDFVREYFPLNFDKCVFVSFRRPTGITIPPKWAKYFPNAHASMKNCLVYGEVQKHPLEFLKTLFNWIRKPA